MNPIVKKFNEFNLTYNLNAFEKTPYYIPLSDGATFYLSDKNGNLCPELYEGDYGYKIDEIFPKIEKIFSDCFGEETSKTMFKWDEKEEIIYWSYNGYILSLIKSPNHPKIGGYRLLIHICTEERL